MDVREKNITMIRNANHSLLNNFKKCEDWEEQVVFIASLLLADDKGRILDDSGAITKFINDNTALILEMRDCLLSKTA